MNITNDPGAVKPGTEYDTFGGNHYSDNSDFYDQPILSLHGNLSPVPEAATLKSLGLILMMGGLALIRIRKRAS